MSWYVFTYSVGAGVEETELEEFPTIEDAQDYAARSLELMARERNAPCVMAAVGAVVHDRIEWLGAYHHGRSGQAVWTPESEAV